MLKLHIEGKLLESVCMLVHAVTKYIERRSSVAMPDMLSAPGSDRHECKNSEDASAESSHDEPACAIAEPNVVDSVVAQVKSELLAPASATVKPAQKSQVATKSRQDADSAKPPATQPDSEAWPPGLGFPNGESFETNREQWCRDNNISSAELERALNTMFDRFPVKAKSVRYAMRIYGEKKWCAALAWEIYNTCINNQGGFANV